MTHTKDEAFLEWYKNAHWGNEDFKECCRRSWNAAINLAAQPAPVQEPIGYLFQHEETGLTMVVDVQQVEWGFEKNNPRHQKIGPVYTTPPAAQRPDVDALVALARADEREACARVCDEEYFAYVAADAIRARGEK